MGEQAVVRFLIFFFLFFSQACMCVNVYIEKGGPFRAFLLSVCSASSTETLISTISSRLCTHVLFVELINLLDFFF